MNICGVDYESVNDAPSISCVIYCSGCTKMCPGCHNPETHDFNYGVPLTNKLINELNEEIDRRPFLNYLVLSGGDPMESAREICDILLPNIHIPNNNLWCYTGFTMEEILQNEDRKELLSWCNSVTDGRFEIDKRDTTLAFRGSSNQRIWKKINGIWTTGC